ncbi:MAG TPA: antibiotic biosynthesis monooxygenase [Verrucomicrobiae bacterium]|nr:antibiotic biosynthesis monooxygenase [Verrucomicrobiae bacterium]
MEKVLIDAFVVPEESKAAFLGVARDVQLFLKSLPGFVEGFLFEKKEGDTRYNFLTTAVWRDEAALENARQAVAAEFQKKGFNPQEIVRRLGIERLRSVCERSPY